MAPLMLQMVLSSTMSEVSKLFTAIGDIIYDLDNITKPDGLKSILKHNGLALFSLCNPLAIINFHSNKGGSKTKFLHLIFVRSASASDSYSDLQPEVEPEPGAYFP